jgi:bifunctional DNA-binding transcriptional regulator/antitoxin component of YhaV-PrlF toxin-antitoxin module
MLRNGQLTVPAEFRKQLGLEESSLLRMTIDKGELRIRPVEVSEGETGSPWLRELYDLFAPWREIALEKGYTEEGINADIDEALREVRAKRA